MGLGVFMCYFFPESLLLRHWDYMNCEELIGSHWCEAPKLRTAPSFWADFLSVNWKWFWAIWIHPQICRVAHFCLPSWEWYYFKWFSVKPLMWCRNYSFVCVGLLLSSKYILVTKTWICSYFFHQVAQACDIRKLLEKIWS